MGWKILFVLNEGKGNNGKKRKQPKLQAEKPSDQEFDHHELEFNVSNSYFTFSVSNNSNVNHARS